MGFVQPELAKALDDHAPVKTMHVDTRALGYIEQHGSWTDQDGRVWTVSVREGLKDSDEITLKATKDGVTEGVWRVDLDSVDFGPFYNMHYTATWVD